jgi:hypothetical protein
LARVFERFTRWQAVRAVLQVASFGVLLWGLTAIAGAAGVGHTP